MKSSNLLKVITFPPLDTVLCINPQRAEVIVVDDCNKTKTISGYFK